MTNPDTPPALDLEAISERAFDVLDDAAGYSIESCYLARDVQKLLSALAAVTAERDEARGAVLDLGDAIIRANGWEPQNGVTVELSSALERLVVERNLLRDARDGYRENLHAAEAMVVEAERQRDAARRDAEQAQRWRDTYRDKLQEAYHGLAELWGLLHWEDGEERDEIPAEELERTLRGRPDFMDYSFAEEELETRAARAAAPQAEGDCAAGCTKHRTCATSTDQPRVERVCVSSHCQQNEHVWVNPAEVNQPLTVTHGGLVAAPQATDEDAEEATCKSCGKPWRNRRHQCADAAPQADEPLPTITESEAERLANLRDCLDTSRGGLHCAHYQEGDSDCHDCGRANYCPDGGVVPDPEPRADETWRDYTIHTDWADEQSVSVLCRSDDVCEEATHNPDGEYLTLGAAVDWAKAHHAKWHAEPLPVAAPDPAGCGHCGLCGSETCPGKPGTGCSPGPFETVDLPGMWEDADLIGGQTDAT